MDEYKVEGWYLWTRDEVVKKRSFNGDMTISKRGKVEGKVEVDWQDFSPSLFGKLKKVDGLTRLVFNLAAFYELGDFVVENGSGDKKDLTGTYKGSWHVGLDLSKEYESSLSGGYDSEIVLTKIYKN